MVAIAESQPGEVQRAYPETWWFAKLRNGVAYRIGKQQQLNRDKDGDRVSALPRNDLSWTAAYIIDRRFDFGLEHGHADPDWHLEPVKKHLAAAQRHLTKLKQGKVDEDHVGAILFRLAAVAELQRRQS